MNRFLTLVLALLTLTSGPAESLAGSSRDSQSILQNSLIELDVSRKLFDLQMPWNKASGNVRKTAVLIAPGEFLTTADGLADATLIRAQKGGRGAWAEARVIWKDYHANLAIVGATPEFSKGMRPVELAAKVSASDEFQIHRWRNGNVEVRKAEFNQFAVSDAKMSFIQLAQLELTSEISGVGWGEPLMAGGRLAGLLTSHTRSICVATPAPFIKGVLDARRKGSFAGIGYFDFVWQPTENPGVHRFLELPGEPRGVIVIEGSKELGQTNLIQVRDLILQVDGFDVDTQGNYHDPSYGHLILENLSSRGRFAGDLVRIKLWRKGQTIDVMYKLPRADHPSRLMPDFIFDEVPEYLIMGGLVFQPLSNHYLKSWGEDWKRRAPFRLNYYNNEPVTKDRQGLVLLTNVLPDAYNLGYQDTRLLVVDEVNGKKISRIADLAEAFNQASDGFHVIRYMRGDSPRRMVLDAKTSKEATERVLGRYGVEEDRHIQPGPAR